jgi:HK97 gp10 family phage protein
MGTKRIRNGRAVVKLTGFDDLDKLLKELEPKVANKLSGQSMRKAGKIVLDAARKKVPVRDGVLKKSLLIKNLAKRNKHKVGCRVMTRPANKWQKSIKSKADAYYAVWVEFGTRFTKPSPYLLPALRENAEQVKAVMKEEALKAIDAEWNKKLLGSSSGASGDAVASLLDG